MKVGHFRRDDNCKHKWRYYIHNVEGKDPEEFTLCDVCGIMLPFEGSQLEQYYKLQWFQRK